MASLPFKHILSILSALIGCLVLISVAIFISNVDTTWHKNGFLFCKNITDINDLIRASPTTPGPNSSTTQSTTTQISKFPEQVGACLLDWYIYVIACALALPACIVQMIFSIVAAIKYRFVGWKIWCSVHAGLCIVFVAAFALVMKFKIHEQNHGTFLEAMFCVDWVFCLLGIIIFIFYARGVKIEIEDETCPPKKCECAPAPKPSVKKVASVQVSPPPVIEKPKEELKVVVIDPGVEMSTQTDPPPELERHEPWNSDYRAKLYNDWKSIHPSLNKIRHSK